MRGGRKLVYVSEEVVDSVAEICRRDGIAISKFVDEALKWAVKLRSMGYELKDALEVLEVIKVHRVLGGAFVPQQVLDLVERAYSSNRDEVLRLFFESGQLYGRYIRRRFKSFSEALKKLLETSRWDLDEVEVQPSGGKWVVVCVSAVMSVEGTEMLAKFLEGVVKGLGFEVLQVDRVKGMVTIEFG
ncbi:MAG: hypothetical protein QXP68_04230 [Thermosphaera sp.]